MHESPARPSITGPVRADGKSKPFAAPAFDLSRYGYVAEEYFLEGTAGAYELEPGAQQSHDGRWRVRRSSQQARYRTRILVVRPTEAAHFNGTVLVHWPNVTAGFEIGSVLPGECVRGYAWVGVSAQKVGIDGFPGPAAAGLRQWDAERYSSLLHPGDAYSYDIFNQAARALSASRPGLANDPLGGLAVERLIASGASQSAARLRSYINGIHRLERLFQAYLPYIDFGWVIPFEEQPASLPAAGAGVEAIRGNRARAQIREDLDVPVFVVNSETESEGYAAVRQPDTDRFRFWEVAGTSHVFVPRALLEQPDALVRAGVNVGDLESPNWLTFRPVHDAALRHLHRWLAHGTLPPHAAPIEMSGEPQPTIRRDLRGNALGGIALPEFAVPSAEHRGIGVSKPGGYRLSFLFGHAREFSAQELAALYPSASVFIQAYRAALDQSVQAGFLLEEDAPALYSVAERWAAQKLGRAQ
jgi:hypothetical protein